MINQHNVGNDPYVLNSVYDVHKDPMEDLVPANMPPSVALSEPAMSKPVNCATFPSWGRMHMPLYKRTVH